jgi:hypothetical protein
LEDEGILLSSSNPLNLAYRIEHHIRYRHCL